MARIPEEEIERIKREVDLVRLVEARGVVLKPQGKNLIGLCCWHDDKEPSLVITPVKNLWHCFGACARGGSNIDWMMISEKVDFRGAVEILRKYLPPSPQATIPERSDSQGSCPSSATITPPSLDAQDHELLLQVVNYYHETLKSSPDALAYLKKRDLDSAEMMERFKIGFANGTLRDRVPKEIRDRLMRLGVLGVTGHEHLSSCIVIPIFDEQGCVVEMYGRKIIKPRGGSPKHLYLPGPHKGVWNSGAFSTNTEMILCEALMDALTFWAAGFYNVTASYGANGFTEDHLAAFKRYGTKRVYIAYDRDDAGEEASASLAEKLMAEGMACYRIQFPKGMDANEYALRVKPAAKSLGLLIANAVATATPAPTGAAGMALPLVAGGQRPPADMPLPLVAEKEMPVEANSPSPPISSLEISAEVKDQEIVIPIGDRRYRIRGLAKNMSYEQMKVNLLSGRGDLFYVDTLDLYSARARAIYIKEAAKELNVEELVIKKELGQVLLKLEALQEEQIKKAIAPKEKAVVLTKEEEEAALELLRDPQLLDRILHDFERCGVVGEETNKLVGYLAATSRKLETPLAVLIQSSSAAGKTALMEAILAFMPKEEVVKYSAMTGQSLFYMEGIDLKHKILAIAEGEGAARASYALKLLQSEGELTIASTGKDPNTGRMVTQEYRLEGPTGIFSTTTVDEVDEEFLNRCLALSANEDREQTRAIHRLQRERHTPEGLWAREEAKRLRTLHQNAQRLLRALPVANPYARHLTFLDDKTRTRRDHEKYLTLIEAIALLHQYQRPIKQESRHGVMKEYIEVTVDDIAIANRLANEVLGRSLDELPPQTRRLLVLVEQMVREACERLKITRLDYRFSRKEIRDYVGWGNTQLKIHLQRLEELEYLLVHRGGRGQSFVYELQYEGQGQKGETFLMGLIDVSNLNGRYDENRSGFKTEKSGLSRPQVGGVSAGGRGNGNGIPYSNGKGSSDFVSQSSKNTYIRERDNGVAVRGRQAV